MKNNLLLLVFVSFTLGAFSQGNIVWKDLEGNELGDEVTVTRHANHTELVFEALISNISSEDKDVRLKRTIVSYNETMGDKAPVDQLCYGSDCRLGGADDPEILTNSENQAAGVDVSTIDPFEMIHYVPNLSIGTTSLTYFILSDTDVEGEYQIEDQVIVHYVVEDYTRIELTFNVDMTDVAGFDYMNDDAFVELLPFGDKSKMKVVKDDNGDETPIFTKTIEVDGDADYSYMYYAEDVAETVTRSEFSVTDTELTFDDVFGLGSTSVSNYNNNDYSIYPNPFNNSLTLNNLDNAKSVEINNILGQTLYSNTGVGNTVEISTSEYQEGLYFVRITDNMNNVHTERLVKQ